MASLCRWHARAAIRGTTAAAAVLAVLIAASPAQAASPPDPEVAVGATPMRPAAVTASSDPAPDEVLRLEVALEPRSPSALADFVAAVSTPGSALYRHYLAPGEFGPRFGATPQAIATVRAALAAQGLVVGTTAPNGLSIPVSGTVRAVSKAFQTSFKRYELRSGASGLANTTAPKLPASVAAHVSGVIGLNQLTRATTGRTLGPGATGPVGPIFAPPLEGSGPVACSAATAAATSTSAYTSPQIASHYGIDSLYATTTGQGVTVAVLAFEPFDPNDVAAFQTCYGTHANVSVVQVNGGAGAGAGSGETALDIEQVIGLAPSANILVYEAPNDGSNMYAELRQIATDNTAQVVTDSWGLCEAETGVPDLARLERPVLQQLAAQGQTVLAATGDTGSAGCYAPPDSLNTALSVWEPASQPEVTAVGGTTVASVTGPDTSWGDGSGASGGGISTLWPMPTYQRARAAISESSGAPCAAASGQLCRQTPDVSASAAVSHGFLAYFLGQWHPVGGTSAAAPLWAAIIALVDSRCGVPVGFVNPALYELAGPGSTSILDVGTGPSNDFTASNAGQYATHAGYDLTTGLGVPAAASLASALCPAAATSGSGTMSVTPNVVSIGQTTTLSFTYTAPNGTGMVGGEIDLTVPGTWPLPTTTPNAVGYTTSSAGTVAIAGTTIVVRGITVPAGKPVVITYGDTGGGGPGVQAPWAAQATAFFTQTRARPTAALTPLAISPAIRVLAGGAEQATLTRIAGDDRVATSIAASRAAFPTNGSAGAVVLARSDQFPDALAGVPLAAQAHGPLLLTPPTGLDAGVAAEIQRVAPLGATVYVLGGTAALSPTIDTQLQTLGYLPHRLQGSTRFDTAVQIAAALGNPTTILEADGTNFPDALAAGPAAVISHGAVLLTNGSKPAPSTQYYLQAHPGLRYTIGGPAATADPGASQKFVGADRYQTSVIVAQSFFVQPSTIGIASGQSFADALSGGPVAAMAGGPIVLTPAAGALPTSTATYLSAVSNSVLSGWLFGGTAAVSTSMADAVAQALVLVPPAT